MIPKGTIELFGKRFQDRQYIYETLRNVYRRFGYDPLQTPALEHAETFDGHHGEGEDLIFRLKDSFNNPLVLRYDLTVPFARFAKDNPDIPRPIKRYQLQMAYRDDEVDKGHFREFMQCDGDIIGSKSLYYDGDVVNLAASGLSDLGFDNYIIRLNHRAIIEGIANTVGYFDKEGILKVQRALDFADKCVKGKKWKNDLESKLAERGFSSNEVNALVKILSLDLGTSTDKLKSLLQDSAIALKGIAEVETIMSYLPRSILHHCSLDLTLARGADYYTGFILEGVLPDVNVGAVLGGGRFDNLVTAMGGNDVGCVGMAFGLDRLHVAMQDKKMFPSIHVPKILFASLTEVTRSDMQLLHRLRSSGLNVDFCAEFKDKKSLLDYAYARDFSAVVLEKQFIHVLDGEMIKEKVESLIQQ